MGENPPDAAQSAGTSPGDDGDDSQWQQHGTEDLSKSGGISTGSQDVPKTTTPLQKRRRVTRACDECRRKKIKCDGKQPCTHCTVYSYECTYDQPSNRRRNPAPQYIEALEARLHKAEALLRVALPNVDLDDPKIEACGIEQILAMAERKAPTPTPKIGQLQQPTPTSAIEADDAQLESMVQNTGSLDIDDNGEYNYHGNSSGYAFLRRLRAEMGDSFSLPRSLPHRPPLKSLYMDSRATSESPLDATLPFANVELPPRDVVKALCRNALDDCCALMRFIHQPSFYEKLERLYNTDPDHYTNADMKFLPLIYLVIAVGSMFSTADDNRLDADGYEKYIGQGYQYFNAGRQMIDITDCRDLTGLQTIMLMVIFLQATAKLSTCYAYVGIALRTCMRLGLHRNVSDNMDFIEQQERKRTFWLVKKMDSYVGAMLGLPQMLSEEDIDQEFPAEVNDECITREAILAQPAGQFPLIRATNAHTRLTVILKKVVKYVYPIKGVQSSTNSSQNRGYMISHAKIQEIESDLQAWMEELPIELRPSDDVPADLSRVQQLLRMSYAHVQMLMYRPFLHYVSSNCKSKGVDKRTFACAAACVSVARNIVHITSEMKKRGLLIGAYWFVMYTTFFAIISLVYFCIENPTSNTSSVILKDAMDGRDTLASLARRSLAADRCTQSLNGVFEGLPRKLQERKNSVGTIAQSRKRTHHKSNTESATAEGNRGSPSVTATTDLAVTPQRAQTFPTETPRIIQHFPNAEHKGISLNQAVPSAYLPTSQSWNASPDSGERTPTSNKSFPEQMQVSPASSNFDSSAGNPNLPDLQNVMFSSENPFAYPNQPMASLEERTFTRDAQANYHNRFGGEPQSHGNVQYDNMAGPLYSNFPPFVPQPQVSHPMETGGSPFPGLQAGMDLSSLQNAHQFQPQSNPEEYWSHLTSTPGAVSSGINLDDLFGSEQWNTVWDHSGMTTGSGYRP